MEMEKPVISRPLVAIPALLLFVFSLGTGWAASELPPNTRKPFIKNYPPITFQGQNQVYDVVRDLRGVLYAGNNVSGVLAYDGVAWQTIPLANNNTAHGLAVSGEGGVFVAGAGEIGYLSVVNGASVYVSLMDHIPEAFAKFGPAQVKCTGDTAWFLAGNVILGWQGNGFIVVENPSGNGFDTIFSVNDTLYTCDRDGTIFKILDNRPVIVFQEQPDLYGAYIFKNDYNMPSVNLVLPYDDTTVLIGSYFRGLLKFDGSRLDLFETEADDLIIGNMGYGAAKLSNGHFAIATVDRGVVVIDRQGRLTALFDKTNGMIDNDVYALYPDAHGSLWVATAYGLSQVLYPSPFAVYDSLSGFDGQVRMTTVLDGIHYIATAHGAFRSRPGPSGLGLQFDRINGIQPAETGVVKPFGRSVLFGSIFGMYLLTPGDEPSPGPGPEPGTGILQPVAQEAAYRLDAFAPLVDRDCRFIHVSEKYPGVVYAAIVSDGVYIFENRSGTWIQKGHVPIADAVFFGEEDAGGRLWLTGMNTGMYRIDFAKGGFSGPEVKNYYTDQGLPKGYYATSMVGRDIFLYSDETFLAYNREEDRFLPDTRFFDNPLLTGILDQGPDGGVWITKGRPRRLSRAVRSENGGYDLTTVPFQRFNNYQVRNFGFDRAGKTFFGADQSLLVFDSTRPFDPHTFYKTILRQVRANERPLFGPGAQGEKPGGPVRLPYGDNNLRFDYAGLYLDVEFQNQYQVRLDGLNKEWSAWTGATYKEYNNLNPGKYRFRVKAANLYGTESDIAEFSFRILPPWWETWWFYLTEILCLGALLFTSFILNRSGEVSRFAKLVTFLTVVVIFESIMFILEPHAQKFGGAVPAAQLMMNVCLVMVLQPSQEFMQQMFIARRKRRKYRILFGPDGQWHGGAHIISSIKGIHNVERWVEAFKKEYSDIDKKYRRYVINDWELDISEKKDILTEMEDLLTILLVFRQYVSQDHARVFSALSPDDTCPFDIEIFSRHWLGSGRITPGNEFSLVSFTRWFHDTVSDIIAMLDTYRDAMADRVFSLEERDEVLGQVEQIFCDILTSMHAIQMSYDK